MNAKVTALRARSEQDSAGVAPNFLPLACLRFGHDFPGADIHARRTDRESLVQSLAENIAKEGVLQSLLICPGPKGDEYFYAIAGNRRLAGLMLLQSNRRIARVSNGDGEHVVDGDYQVPVLVREGVTPGTALALSLAESIHQVPLHPIDRYEAFAAIEGTPGDIAARFGTSEKIVKQALALGKLAKCVRAAWRAGELSAEQARAFAASDDVDDQEREFIKIKDGRGLKYTNADEIRKLFVKSENEAKRLLTFVGRDVYVAAGGRLSEDLFGDSAEGIAHDLSKLKKLASAKLEAEAERLKVEGWSFAESAGLRVNHMLGQGAAKTQPKYTPVEKDRIKAIDERIKDIDKQESGLVEGEGNAVVDENLNALEDERERLDGERARIRHDAAFRGSTEAQKKKTGVAVAIDEDGHLRLVGGIAKPKGEAKAKKSAGASAHQPPRYEEPELGWNAKRAINHAKTLAAEALLLKDLPLSASVLLAGISLQLQAHSPIRDVGSQGLTHAKDFCGALAEMRKLKPDAQLKLFGQAGATSIDAGACNEAAWNALVAVLDAKEYAAGLTKHFERREFFKDCNAKRLLASIKNALGADQERQNKDKKKEALAAFCIASIPAGWLPPELRTKAYVAPMTKTASRSPKNASRSSTLPQGEGGSKTKKAKRK